MLHKVLKKVKKTFYYLTGTGKDFECLFQDSIDGIYRSTLDGRYLEVNKALVNMLGYRSKKELLRINTRDLYFSPDDRPSHDERDRIFSTFLKKKDGSRIFVEISSKVQYVDGRPRYYEGIVRDRTEYKKYEEKIKYLSFHDSLTGLYNRAYFNEELKKCNQSRKLPVTIIMADVDNLKHVNDTLGHEAGDRLLKKVADILMHDFRNEDIIARTGGDEFCIILPDTSREEALMVIQRIKIKCEFESSEKFPISISFGAAERKNTSDNLKNILRNAEKNMYKDKRKKPVPLNT